MDELDRWFFPDSTDRKLIRLVIGCHFKRVFEVLVIGHPKVARAWRSAKYLSHSKYGNLFENGQFRNCSNEWPIKNYDHNEHWENEGNFQKDCGLGQYQAVDDSEEFYKASRQISMAYGGFLSYFQSGMLSLKGRWGRSGQTITMPGTIINRPNLYFNVETGDLIDKTEGCLVMLYDASVVLPDDENQNTAPVGQNDNKGTQVNGSSKKIEWSDLFEKHLLEKGINDPVRHFRTEKNNQSKFSREVALNFYNLDDVSELTKEQKKSAQSSFVQFLNKKID